MLNGQKVKLIPLEKIDLQNAIAWANDLSLNAKMLRTLPITQTNQEKWYQNIIQDPSKLVFAIKTHSEEIHIGNTGFYHMDRIHRRAEFWILIGEKDFWRKGIGKDVVLLMQNYAFRNLNLNKLYLNVGVDNHAAIDLYKKFSFVEEGLFKRHYYIEGEYIDVLRMAILKEYFENEK